MKSAECERLDHEWCQGEGDKSCDCHCHRPGSKYRLERARVGALADGEPSPVHSIVAAVLWGLAWLALIGGFVGALSSPDLAIDPSVETGIQVSWLVMGVAGFAIFAAAACVINLLLAIHARLGTVGGSGS